MCKWHGPWWVGELCLFADGDIPLAQGNRIPVYRRTEVESHRYCAPLLLYQMSQWPSRSMKRSVAVMPGSHLEKVCAAHDSTRQEVSVTAVPQAEVTEDARSVSWVRGTALIDATVKLVGNGYLGFCQRAEVTPE